MTTAEVTAESTAPASPPSFPPAGGRSSGPRGRTSRVLSHVSDAFARLGFERPGRWFWILALAALVDIVVLSWAQIRAYDSYYTFSQDFGSLNQAFYTTVFNHRLFYYTSNLPAGSGGSFLAIHFAPLLFVLLPFYALVPAPTTLLVIKVVVLALGAFPVFGIARHRLKSPRWGFAFGLAFLLSPLIMTLDWISFDLEAFLPLFVLSALYFLTLRRRLPFFLFWTLALATIETIAPLLAVCAFVGLLATIWGPRLGPEADRKVEQTFWTEALVLTIGWVLAAYFILQWLSPSGGTFGGGYASHYTVLGASSFPDVLPQALLHPDLAGSALAYAGSTKLLYVLLLFGGLAFLTLFGEARYYLPVLAWLVLAVLSNFPPMYSLGSQYLGYVTPFLFVGAIGGAQYLQSLIARSNLSERDPGRVPSRPERRWHLPTPEQSILPLSLGLTVAVSLAVANPLTGQPIAGLTSLQYGIPSPNPHTNLLDRTINLIPAHASVFTTAHLFPQVSDRLNAYVLPTTQDFAASNTYWGSLNQFINDSSYVLLDFTLDLYVSQLILYFGDFSHFGIVVDSDGVFLLERGWTGPPLTNFWSGSEASYPGEDLTTKTAEKIPSNQSLFYRNVATANATIWRGPNLNHVLPGTYNVTVDFRVRALAAVPLFSYQLLWTAINIGPVEYLITSFGHHYNYVLTRAPPVPVAQVNVTAGRAMVGEWVTLSVSLTVPVTGLGTIGSVGTTMPASFSVYVFDITMTLVGPPPYLGPEP